MARAPEIIVKVNWTQCTNRPFVWNQSEEMVDGWLTLIMCERFKTRRAQERCQLYIRASDAQFYSCLGWQCIHIIVDLGNHWVKHILWDHCPKEQDLPPLSTQYDLILFGLMLYANFSLAGIYTYAKSWFVWITNFLSCFCFWLTGFKADDALTPLLLPGKYGSYSESDSRSNCYNCCFTKKQSYNMINFPSSCD